MHILMWSPRRMKMKNSKIDIYGTLGPACQQQEILEKMFSLGMTGMRLNLSHTGLDQCDVWLKNFHAAAKSAKVAAKLLIDLQGPELRIGNIEACRMPEHTTVILGKGGIPVPRVIFEQMEPGQQILLDDGKILLMAEEIRKESGEKTAAVCKVLRGGLLRSRKSIALPQLSVNAPTLTESDRKNLKLAGEYGVTGVMLPFVRGAFDLKILREALQKEGAEKIRIFAKIENMDGVRKLQELLPYADEIVIARGDLGNAMPLWELPGIQYEVGKQCRKAGKPYMVVTQMLASMEHAAVPTRAEVSDIFYAVLHGASSVMLTGETAAGEYPAEAMEYMCKTVECAQKYEL